MSLSIAQETDLRWRLSSVPIGDMLDSDPNAIIRIVNDVLNNQTSEPIDREMYIGTDGEGTNQ